LKVLVLGSGVVGTTTAYYLNAAGHDVTVVDRCDGAGLETSFANGGQVSVCHSEPWATPSTPLRALKWFGRKDAPLLFKLRMDPALWGWTLRFLINCTASRSRENTEKALRIAAYSRDCLQNLRKETGISYDHREQGILHIYRDQKEFDGAAEAAETMRQHGLQRRMVNPDECAAIEPALSAVKSNLVGGYYSPDDESGDAYKFTDGLAKIAESKGVQFKFGTSVRCIETDGNKVSGILTDKGRLQADAYIVSLGSYSPLLLKPLGMKVPIYPAKGYSVTLPIEDKSKAPITSLTDDEHKIVFSRLGDRLRVAGTAEFSGYNTQIENDRPYGILRQALSLFPGCANPDKAEFWTGLRPKTPDSVPVIGSTVLSNLYLNTGHGTLGWTMSCGSAKAISDLISGKNPEISLSGFGAERF